MTVGNNSSKRQRAGQHRAADGKFETGFVVGGRKNSNYNGFGELAGGAKV